MSDALNLRVRKVTVWGGARVLGADRKGISERSHDLPTPFTPEEQAGKTVINGAGRGLGRRVEEEKKRSGKNVMRINSPSQGL